MRDCQIFEERDLPNLDDIYDFVFRFGFGLEVALCCDLWLFLTCILGTNWSALIKAKTARLVGLPDVFCGVLPRRTGGGFLVDSFIHLNGPLLSCC